MREQLKWHDEKADNSPWINALAELRQRASARSFSALAFTREPGFLSSNAVMVMSYRC